MDKKHEIIICLGSSCFARGNKNLIKVIQDFLKENDLGTSVNLSGQRCFDQCANGPSVKINNEVYNHVSEASLVRILEQTLY